VSNGTKAVQSRLKSPAVWCFTTYFAEGLPYTIVRSLSSVFFTDIGMKERYIGYLNFLGIPWNFKFIWAPLLDLFGKKRTWMIAFQALITLLCSGVAVSNFLIGTGNAAAHLTFISISFIALAFLSASNDIAIDGFYMDGIPDKKEQAAYTGYRVFAWRLAFILGRSGFVALAAYVAARNLGAGKYEPWGYAFAAGSLTMLAITLFHTFALPQVEVRTREKKTLKKVAVGIVEAFATYVETTAGALGTIVLVSLILAVLALNLALRFIPETDLAIMISFACLMLFFVLQQKKHIALMLIFIVFYKIGDEILFSMGTPFLMRELLVTKAQYAWLSGLVGAFGAIAGASIGGIWIKKKGLKKAIWPLTILMNFNIWAYIWLAYAKPVATLPSGETHLAGVLTIAAVHCYEQIAAGLGNAVLIVYLLRTCKPEYKASHYAVGSAIMSLCSTFFGGYGGVIVEHMGYLNMFLLSFLVSVPAMLLLFVTPIKD
jgi:PAT family beta-lactamase induction signal transducer AmpG